MIKWNCAVIWMGWRNKSLTWEQKSWSINKACILKSNSTDRCQKGFSFQGIQVNASHGGNKRSHEALLLKEFHSQKTSPSLSSRQLREHFRIKGGRRKRYRTESRFYMNPETTKWNSNLMKDDTCKSLELQHPIELSSLKDQAWVGSNLMKSNI